MENIMPRMLRCAWRAVVTAALACTVPATTACVRWQSVPPAEVSARPPLPRWLRVTKRDSTRLLLEQAQLRGDTLIGRASDDAGDPLARIPMADVAHLEAREPSVSGSVGVAALVMGAVAAFAFIVGHAAST